MSNIEWTDRTWNPVVGCTPVSAGCLNCYAATMGVRLEAMGRPEYVGLTVKRDGRAVFTGKVNTLEDRLKEPLSWKKPSMVFVNSMSDLFHEAVPFEFIDKVFAVMAMCPQHTFQVLTKRPERMAEYMGTDRFASAGRHGAVLGSVNFQFNAHPAPFKWPLPNVWLGTSCEDQKNADERIPHLLTCPAAVRFLSCEPLIGPLDIAKATPAHPWGVPIDWVIVGGESGPRARMCDVDWIRRIVEDCKAEGVPCFVKQLGTLSRQTNGMVLKMADKKGGDPSEWPEELRVREFPRSST